MNEIQKAEMATNGDIINMLTHINIYYDFTPTDLQLKLYLEALSRKGDLTKAAVQFMYDQATLSMDICNAARYKAPITPPLLLELLKNTEHDVAQRGKTYTHAEVLAYCDRNATTMQKSFTLIEGQTTKDGKALWAKR